MKQKSLRDKIMAQGAGLKAKYQGLNVFPCALRLVPCAVSFPLILSAYPFFGYQFQNVYIEGYIAKVFQNKRFDLQD